VFTWHENQQIFTGKTNVLAGNLSGKFTDGHHFVYVARVVVRAGTPYFFLAQTGANIILAGKRGPDIRRPLPDN